ncbi:MAG: hypothetical protein HY042_12880, partial [Spirochaetia bacterium]|nr:hypothetical protein [Spirochaetia bacterium]
MSSTTSNTFFTAGERLDSFRAEKFEDALGAYLDELPDTIGQNAQLIEDYALGAIV